MSFFNLFKRKPKPAKREEPSAQNRVTTGDAKQSKANISSFIKVITEIIPSVAEEIIPAEKECKTLLPASMAYIPMRFWFLIMLARTIRRAILFKVFGGTGMV